MMDSSNLDHHHQQELHGGSSPLTSSSFPLFGGLHEWNQDLIVNGGNFIPNAASGVLSSPRDFSRLSTEVPVPPLISHMVQDIGFHWAPGTSEDSEGYISHLAHQANMQARIKEELYPKLGRFIKSEQQGMHELDERLFLSSFSSGCQTNGIQPPCAGDLLMNPPNCSMVLPTANILNMNPPSSSYMDLQALDLLASARFGRSFCKPSLDNMALLGGDDIPFGLGHLQEQVQVSTNSHHHKTWSLASGVSEGKRGNNSLEHKASQGEPKKPRFETRSSSTSFKVTKEKLGDRIAALQQLVAPFGKTDTASVLMEAIGYIKFLQDQVETLSVPYMRSSNKRPMTTHGAASEDTDEPEPDLLSRGLCLVPLSCTSYITNENGGVWSPPNYRGSN